MVEPDLSFDSTTFSRSMAIPPAGNRRRDPRLLSILRVGKLITARTQELCMIRNISAGGVMADVYSPRAVGEQVSVEVRSDQRLAGHIVWVDEATIGVEFDEAVDVGEILAHVASPSGRRPRPPRIEVPARARLRIGAHYHRVAVRDLSQGGVKIGFDEPLAIGQTVVVTVDGLGPHKGSVRWWRDGAAGVAFHLPIPFDDLTHWIGSNQR